jgi:hypothetical protein
MPLGSTQLVREMIKVKGQVHPRTGHEGPKGEYRYSLTLSLTLALDGYQDYFLEGKGSPCIGLTTMSVS